jgi:hypothetical protein
MKRINLDDYDITENVNVLKRKKTVTRTVRKQ